MRTKPETENVTHLDDLGTVNRGRSRHRPRNDPSLYGGDYPFFQTGDIKAANLYLSDFSQTYNVVGLAQSKLWNPGTLCITIAANIAETAILRVPGCFPDSVVGFVADPKKADVRFIKYYIDTIKLRMQNISHGATQDNLSVEKLLSFDFAVPDLPTQRKIAGILSAYDDLIENNLRRIRILEEMAQSLYREWFVHFRFPGHESVPLVKSALGMIPEGWEVKKLGDLAEDVRRGIPKGDLCEPAQYVGLEHIPRKSLALDDWEVVSELGSNKLLFKRGEILFGKIRPYFHKVSVAPFSGICSADTIVIRSKEPENRAIVTACVSSEAFVAHASATANGAKMPRANWKVLAEYPLVNPPEALKAQFSKFYNNAIEKPITLIRRNQVLSQVRALLLPKLLSGQLSLPVDELIIEQAPLPCTPAAPAPRPTTSDPVKSPEPPVTTPKPAPAGKAARSPGPIDEIARTEVLCAIRKLFNDGGWRVRETTLKELSVALGYRRLGPRIREVLSTDLLTAVRRGILASEGGEYTLGFRAISDLPRDTLKSAFLSAIGRAWITRDDAIRAFARHLGFARTGDQINAAARSLINELIRKRRLETGAGKMIRRQ